jgi:hypothetical protein
VFDIIAGYLNKKNWKETLEECIPSRKVKQEGKLEEGK